MVSYIMKAAQSRKSSAKTEEMPYIPVRQRQSCKQNKWKVPMESFFATSFRLTDPILSLISDVAAIVKFSARLLAGMIP